jgi:hypothetical protein
MNCGVGGWVEAPNHRSAGADSWPRPNPGGRHGAAEPPQRPSTGCRNDAANSGAKTAAYAILLAVVYIPDTQASRDHLAPQRSMRSARHGKIYVMVNTTSHLRAFENNALRRMAGLSDRRLSRLLAVSWATSR